MAEMPAVVTTTAPAALGGGRLGESGFDLAGPSSHHASAFLSHHPDEVTCLRFQNPRTLVTAASGHDLKNITLQGDCFSGVLQEGSTSLSSTTISGGCLLPSSASLPAVASLSSLPASSSSISAQHPHSLSLNATPFETMAYCESAPASHLPCSADINDGDRLRFPCETGDAAFRPGTHLPQQEATNAQRGVCITSGTSTTVTESDTSNRSPFGGGSAWRGVAGAPAGDVAPSRDGSSSVPTSCSGSLAGSSALPRGGLGGRAAGEIGLSLQDPGLQTTEAARCGGTCYTVPASCVQPFGHKPAGGEGQEFAGERPLDLVMTDATGADGATGLKSTVTRVRSSEDGHEYTMGTNSLVSNSGLATDSYMNVESTVSGLKAKSAVTATAGGAERMETVGVMRQIQDICHHYALGRKLGSGYTASVYEARCLATGQTVAIKDVDKSRQRLIACDSYYRAVYETLAKLPPHRHLLLPPVALLETGTHFYIVMEKCHGSDMVEYVLKHPPAGISTSACKRLMQQLLLAIHVLHSHNVLHRDIKLDNIMFRHRHEEPPRGAPPKNHKSGSSGGTSALSNEVALIDFDMCLLLDRPGPPKPLMNANEISVVGTREYMAPECYKGHYSAASDMWSIGVILYVLIDGHFPFDVNNCSKQQHSSSKDDSNQQRKSSSSRDIRRLLRQGVRFESRIKEKHPLAVDLVQRLLTYDPTQRLSSAYDALCHPWLNMVASPLPRAPSSAPVPVISLVPPKSLLGFSGNGGGANQSLSSSYQQYCLSSSSPAPSQRGASVHPAALGPRHQSKLTVVDLRGEKTAAGADGDNDGDWNKSLSCSRASTSVSPCQPLHMSQTVHVSYGKAEEAACGLPSRCSGHNGASIKRHANDQARYSRHYIRQGPVSLDLSHGIGGMFLSGAPKALPNNISNTRKMVFPDTASRQQSLSAIHPNNTTGGHGIVGEQAQRSIPDSVLSSLSSSPATPQTAFQALKQGHEKVTEGKGSSSNGKHTGDARDVKLTKKPHNHQTSELAMAAAVMLLKQQDTSGRHGREREKGKERGTSKDRGQSSLYQENSYTDIMPEVSESLSSTYRHSNTDWPFSDFPPPSPPRGSARTHAYSKHRSSPSTDAPNVHVSQTRDQASSRSAAVDAATAAALSFLMPKAIDGSKVSSVPPSLRQNERDNRLQHHQLPRQLQVSNGQREATEDSGCSFLSRYGDKKKKSKETVSSPGVLREPDFFSSPGTTGMASGLFSSMISRQQPSVDRPSYYQSAASPSANSTSASSTTSWTPSPVLYLSTTDVSGASPTVESSCSSSTSGNPASSSSLLSCSSSHGSDVLSTATTPGGGRSLPPAAPPGVSFAPPLGVVSVSGRGAGAPSVHAADGVGGAWSGGGDSSLEATGDIAPGSTSGNSNATSHPPGTGASWWPLQQVPATSAPSTRQNSTLSQPTSVGRFLIRSEEVSQREKLILNDSLNRESHRSVSSSVAEAHGYIPLSSISTDTSVSGETKPIQSGARLTLAISQSQSNSDAASHAVRVSTVARAGKEEITRTHYSGDGVAQPPGSAGGACIVDGGRLRGDNYSSISHPPQAFQQRQYHTSQTAQRMLLLARGEDGNLCLKDTGTQGTQDDRSAISESGLTSSLPPLGGSGGTMTGASPFPTEAH
ncbi:protein other [Cystoisospora suis]|uniref:Protein other n=1 Tax=Cystoisospora suis TaxID=483139 RepID=A0A2C6KTN2_9APIC|nr:protein other [Cystoisospora suis]